VIEKLIPLIQARYLKLSEVGVRYQKSSVNNISHFDKLSPISVTSTFGSSQTNPIVERTQISWSKVIGTPLTEEIPLEYSTTTFRSFKRADQPTAEIHPIEDESIIEFQFHMFFVNKDIKAAL